MFITYRGKHKRGSNMFSAARLITLLTLAVTLLACGSKSTPPTHQSATPKIIGTIDMVDFVKLSLHNAYVSVKLTETHKETGEYSTHSSTQISHINPENMGFELAHPSKIDPNINYGIAIELVTGTSRPRFTAWYPLDLSHYKGNKLSTRLFPSDSSTLVNFQILALDCTDFIAELATDQESLWLNANGAGYFLQKNNGQTFTNDYATVDLSTLNISLGETQFTCSHKPSQSIEAKTRFSGAVFKAVDRKSGWAVTIFDNHIKLVTNRGLKTELIGLTTSANLNANWQIDTENGYSIHRIQDIECKTKEQGISLLYNGIKLEACGKTLR